MADTTKTAEELALQEDCTDRDDTVGRLVDDDDGVVCAGGGAESFELGTPGLFSGVGYNCKHREDGKVASAVVGGGKGTNLHASLGSESCNEGVRRCGTYVEFSGQLLADVSGDVLRREEKVEFSVGSERHYV